MKRSSLLTILILFLSLQAVFGQAQQVTGKVTSSEDNTGLPGVTVMIKGTTIGTTTDFDGNYSIEAPSPQSIIVYNFVGFKEVEREASTNVINVVLEPEALELDEIVVVGYGVKKAGAITGAVQSVGAQEIESIPVPSFDQILQGQSAGVTVIATSGRPGAAASVTIRGQGSINAGTDPLYIIDGVPVEARDFSTLNPNDIESMSILKDASATAIYGSRAANGVILITTKRGKKGEATKIIYRGQMGFSERTKVDFNMMNSQEKLDYEIYLGLRDTLSTETMAVYDSLRNVQVDWDDIVFSRGITNSHEVSARGGSEKTRFFVSGGYFLQEGILLRSDFERYTGRMNLEHDAYDWLRLGANLTLGYEHDNRTVSTGNVVSNPVFAAYLANPYESPYNPDGSYKETLNSFPFGMNPIRELDLNESKTNQVKSVGNVYVEIEPIENLVIKPSLGIDFYDYTSHTYWDPISYSGIDTDGYVGKAFQRGNTFTFTNTANYSFDINTVHNFSVLGGFESIESKIESFNVGAQGFANSKIRTVGAASQIAPGGWGGGISEWSVLSFFGTANYDYNGKYFLDVSLRRDGSSRFGANRRYANFWSVGGSWNLKRESFLANFDPVTSLKLRASYGTSGNFEIGNYLARPLYGYGLTYMGQPGSAPSNPGNENLTWEQSYASNIGIDAYLYSRIRLSLEFYSRTTTDMLLEVPFSYTSGFSGGWDNVGEMRNRGIEFMLEADILKINDFVWNLNMNFAYNQNEILKLYGDRDEMVTSGTNQILRVGEPYGNFFMTRYAGVNPANGDALWYDKNGNITNTYSDDDAVLLAGKLMYPPYTGGITSRMNYKGFTLSAFFTYVYGKHMLSNTRYFTESHSLFAGYNQSREMLNMWREPGDVTEVPIPKSANNQFDTRLLEDASFIRLRNLTIRYNLNPKYLSSISAIKGVEIYGQGQNLMTWSSYSGWDPENPSNIELNAYPVVKTFTLGLNLTF